MSTPERMASTEAEKVSEQIEENAHYAAERGHAATDQ
jgi:hypothetical protein